FENGRFNAKTLAFIKRVFKNRIDNDWIAQMSFRKFKLHLWPFIPKFYVIKFVRANLALAAFSKNFHIPTIFITRHPHAVIFSQQRVRFPWLYDLNIFAAQETLHNYLFEKTGINLKTEKFTDIQKLAVRWGIENQLFEIPKNETVRHYYYEDLKGNLSLIKEIFHFAKMNIPDNLEEKMTRPSSKMHPKSTILKNKTEELSETDKTIVNAILLKFPFQIYNLSP